MPKDDGGQAFPHVVEKDPLLSIGRDGEITVVGGGMTLRDYFAGHALFLMGAGMLHFKKFTNVPAEPVPRALAEGAYEVADAMLAERKK